MLDARAEIDLLRQRLRMRNMSEDLADSICDDVAREISIVTSDLLADAMNDAVNLGGDVGSEEMIEELRAVRSGPSFEIITDSGKTDFSEPPFPMLPRFLKNAKVAADGSLYKVIPIKDKTQGSDSSKAVTVEAALRNINSARRIAKQERDKLRESDRVGVTPDAMKGMDTFASMHSINRSRKLKDDKRNQDGPLINFRTASSKQDPSKKWVMPGKIRDVGSPLREINMNLQDNIDRAIQETIRKHEDMY